jgi:hypothetical protein
MWGGGRGGEGGDDKGRRKGVGGRKRWKVWEEGRRSEKRDGERCKE